MGVGDLEPEAGGGECLGIAGRGRSGSGQLGNQIEIREPSEAGDQLGDQPLVERLISPGLAKRPTGAREGFQGTDDRQVKHQFHHPSHRREVPTIAESVKHDGLDPGRKVGEVELREPIARDRRDDRRVERLGQREQGPRPIAGRGAGVGVDDRPRRRGDRFNRPFDHRQIGRTGPPGEDRPTDVRGHQPGVEVSAGQTSQCADGPGPDRTGPGSEMLDP